MFQGRPPGRQGQDLTLTVLYVPHSLDNGLEGAGVGGFREGESSVEGVMQLRPSSDRER